MGGQWQRPISHVDPVLLPACPMSVDDGSSHIRTVSNMHLVPSILFFGCGLLLFSCLSPLLFPEVLIFGLCGRESSVTTLGLLQHQSPKPRALRAMESVTGSFAVAPSLAVQTRDRKSVV